MIGSIEPLPVIGHLGSGEQIVKPALQRSVFYCENTRETFSRNFIEILMTSARISFFDIDRTKIRLLLGTLFALVVADGILSNYLVTHGLGKELNPISQVLISQGNLISVKLLGALLAALILWDIQKKRPKAAMLVTLCAVTLYTGILYWNLLTFVIVQI